MNQPKKYTLGESAVIGGFSAIFVPVVVALGGVLTLPFALWRADFMAKEEKESSINWKSTIFGGTIGPAVTLGIAWLVHHYALTGR